MNTRFASASLFVLFLSGLAACAATSDLAPPPPSEGSPADGTSPEAGAEGGAACASSPAAQGSAGWVCAPSVEVATAADIYAQIETLTEAVEKPGQWSSGAALRPSPDLHATRDIVLRASELAARLGDCVADDGGASAIECGDAQFGGEQTAATVMAQMSRTYTKLGTSPEGVTCTAPGSRNADACLELRITAGTTVRFARVLEQGLADHPRWWHEVRALRACATPCAKGEIACGPAQRCFRAGESSCLLCEGKSQEACACRDACGEPKAEGAACSYRYSEEIDFSGTCQQGSCAKAADR